MHAPCEEHLEVVYRILRYFRETPGKVCSSRRIRQEVLRPSQVMVGQDQLRIEDQLRLLHICMGKFGDLE